MVAAFAGHIALGETVELGVDEGEELVGGGLVAAIHRLEEDRDLTVGEGHRTPAFGAR
jgi:hypothetical protein